MKTKRAIWPARLRGRAAVRDATAVAVDDGIEAPPIESAGGMVTTSLLGRCASVLVTAALVAGPVALAVTALRDGGSTAVAAPPAPVVVDTSSKDRVGEFAVSVVTVTVTASINRKTQSWVPGDTGTTAQGMRITDAAVVDAVVVESTSSGQEWSVTVAGTITGDRGPSARRFFHVPVLLDKAGLMRALGGVGVVAGPVYGDPGRLAYGEPVTARPVRDAVTGFLAAMLTGAGDVARYVSPGAEIAAVTPAPFAKVNLVTLTAGTDVEQLAAEGTQVRVLAIATGVVSASEELPLAYALTLTMRAGRWEVSLLDPAPLRSPIKDSGAVAPGTSSPSAAAEPTK
jgi:hypothetical protein